MQFAINHIDNLKNFDVLPIKANNMWAIINPLYYAILYFFSWSIKNAVFRAISSDVFEYGLFSDQMTINCG